jgi:hypothetical protein
MWLPILNLSVFQNVGWELVAMVNYLNCGFPLKLVRVSECGLGAGGDGQLFKLWLPIKTCPCFRMWAGNWWRWTIILVNLLPWQHCPAKNNLCISIFTV